MKTPAARALMLGTAVAGLLAWLHVLGGGLPLLLAMAVLIAVLTLVLPTIARRWASDLVHLVRWRFWARDQGRFHSFGGVPLQIEDDGRTVWVDGDGLQRVLGRREREDVLAARLAGQWQRNDQGVLMLRVDAVVNLLAAMPGRDEPRVQRLRRYFEREVLFPAAQRRTRR